ncbi:lipoamide acyltransferase component of branched-chain alpha-keto acid dehydrogenase complex, mitochondrial isoform X2 [Pararge aegeria]|uniref:lipoamide acyltransferase component of branched-chain alpha-keto acid dehydrogenase complex, mitochondrial isoform X2 n=1 Tax=Pararge aegeria TaxID=116150 RepID=UPI0019D0F020|nr:lipoamide acyltransferase component of branched-chain alpha-keto acid dehydrogenase complex, mitochondrial isoform X2 [Pararge aegeria]
MMAFAARKWLGNLRNINKYNKLCYTNFTYNSWIYANNVPRIKNQYNTRWLHTTSSCNKIVAFKLSDIGEGIREVIVKEWFVKVGDKVEQFDNICEVQSDKAAVTISSRYDGVITKLHHEVDQTAFVGQPLVDIEVDVSGDADTPPPDSTTNASKDIPKTEDKSPPRTKVLTTPAVRRIAAQFQVDLSSVNATGRNGRVLKEDVLSHLNITSDKSNDVLDKVLSVEAISIPTTTTATAEFVLEDKIVPVTGFMKAMVKSMTEAMKIPHFVFSDEYDVTKLVKSREGLKELAQKRGVKLTYMPIIIKAASQSLLTYPVLNSSLDSSNENLIYKASHNIGVAMDTPNGLVVPVIRNVQRKSIFEIAIELNSLQEKGLKGQLGLSDLTGGTFTISNIGIIGGTYTKPIILPPQVSIGALGKIQVLPRFDSEGNVVKAHILSVSWSADHRVIDGVTMARFSNQLKEYLEDPQKLILDL